MSRLTGGLLPPEGRRTPDCCGLIFRVLLVVDTCRKELVAICRRQIVRFRSVKPSRATVHRTVAFDCSIPFLHKNLTGYPGWDNLLNGTPEGTRTPNPRNRNPMLYPLSHRCILLQPSYYNSLSLICKGVIFEKNGRTEREKERKPAPFVYSSVGASSEASGSCFLSAWI